MREIAQTIRRVLDQKEEKEESIGGRILLVEDDDQMLKTLRRILEGAGHQVAEAPGGKVAARLYRESPTDVIITDLIMPEKEGLGLIMELKGDFPEVRIIPFTRNRLHS